MPLNCQVIVIIKKVTAFSILSVGCPLNDEDKANIIRRYFESVMTVNLTIYLSIVISKHQLVLYQQLSSVRLK